MAMLKSINKYASAPLAPTELPANALMLVEIDGQVYRIDPADLATAAGGLAIPDPPGSGTVVLTSTNGTLSWEAAG